MFVKYPKELFIHEDIMSEELIFPVMTFLSKYSATANSINSTIGCILFEFSINPITRNTDKIKSCLRKLHEKEFIEIHTELDKINTPILITVNEFNSWVAIHDFEIDTIKKIVSSESVSYKIGDLFMAIKFKSFSTNARDENLNLYDSTSFGYTKLSTWSGISNNGTISKYVSLLGNTEILKVEKTEERTESNGKMIFKTTHKYSFKIIK